MGKLILIIVAIGVIVLVITQLMPNKKRNVESEERYDLNRYYLKNSIVTPVEKWMYVIIKDELPEEYMVAPKVGIKDFVGVKKGNNYMKYFGHIAQRHIDFLVCKRDTLTPAFGIEIDDTSHEQQQRKTRDQENDDIFNAIGIKVLHITTKTKEAELRDRLRKELTPVENVEK